MLDLTNQVRDFLRPATPLTLTFKRHFGQTMSGNAKPS
jgi:hypothetical protein